MFLRTLKIEQGSSLIREISFFKGINLIVDETRTKSNEESGNNVVNTTVLRLVDFCLGGDGKNIYSDTEFRGKSNTQIEQFLKDANVLVPYFLRPIWKTNIRKKLKSRGIFLAMANRFRKSMESHTITKISLKS